MAPSHAHRSVWLSDVHLGTRACRVDLLLDFLGNLQCDTLYLVGDIVDVQRLRRTFHWPATHTQVLRLIMKKTQQGMRVVYIPGNHDDDFRALAGTVVGGVEIMLQAVHTTRDGRRFLVIHGDEFDGVINCGGLASIVGNAAYGTLLSLNRLVHCLNRLLGRPYWSLSQHVKARIGKAVRYIGNFERACLLAAKERGLDGVICGHIHKADIAERNGLLYCNDGDWVESCTALVEDRAGELSLLKWSDAPSAVAETAGAEVRDAA